MFEKVFLDENDNDDEQDEQTDTDRDDDDHKLWQGPRGHDLVLSCEGRGVRQLVVLLNQLDQAVGDDDPGLAGDVDVGLQEQAATDRDCCAVVIRDLREGATMNQSAVSSCENTQKFTF